MPQLEIRLARGADDDDVDDGRRAANFLSTKMNRRWRKSGSGEGEKFG